MEEQKREVDYQKWTWKVLEYTTKAVMGIIVIAFLYQGVTKGYTFGYELFHSEPLTKKAEVSIELEITGHDSALEVGKLLEKEHIISSALVFWAQSYIYELDMRSGVYQVSSDMSSKEILTMLDLGKQEKSSE